MADTKHALKKFSAQLSYTTNSGYGCSVGFKGDDKRPTPQDALVCLLHEVGFVAERAGMGDLAIAALKSRILDVRAAIAKAEGCK